MLLLFCNIIFCVKVRTQKCTRTLNSTHILHSCCSVNEVEGLGPFVQTKESLSSFVMKAVLSYRLCAVRDYA